MFIGEYSHNLDTKGRIVIPNKFREELQETFILTRGLDGCLTIYSNEQWQTIFRKLSNLPSTKRAARQYIHMLTSRACECSLDKQGRIQIPAYLSDPVNIKKECVVVGVNDHIEIWDKDTWNAYYEEASESYEEIAEELTDFLTAHETL